jgi:hypothetical protein
MTRIRTILTALPFVVPLVAPARQPPQSAFDVRREVLLPRDMKTEPIQPIRSSAAGGPGLVWSTRVPRTVAWGPTIRVHINVVRPEPASPWRVVVKDATGRETERVDGAALAAAKDWWSGEVPTPTATIELWVDGTPPQAEIEIDQYAFGVTPAIPQAIVGVNDMKDITSAAVPARVKNQASPVARLRFMVPDGEAVCTGFLVGPDLLMTNEHCINNDDQARTALVEFGYDSEAAQTRRYRVLKVEAADFGLDYSLLRLSGDASQHRRLFLEASAAANRARLYVIQHPGGLPKKAAFPPNCGVDGAERAGRDATNTDFGHICDTLGGSSGSPVLDWTTGRVVGLHHLGFRAGIDEPVNQAVHIRDILAHLKGRVDEQVLKEVARPPQ